MRVESRATARPSTSELMIRESLGQPVSIGEWLASWSSQRMEASEAARTPEERDTLLEEARELRDAAVTEGIRELRRLAEALFPDMGNMQDLQDRKERRKRA